MVNVVDRVLDQATVNVKTNQYFGVALRGNLQSKSAGMAADVQDSLVFEEVAAAFALRLKLGKHKGKARVPVAFTLIGIGLEPVPKHLVFHQFLEVRALLVILGSNVSKELWVLGNQFREGLLLRLDLEVVRAGINLVIELWFLGRVLLV